MRTSHASLTTRRAVEDGESRLAREEQLQNLIRRFSYLHRSFVPVHEFKLVAEKRRVDFADFVASSSRTAGE